MITIDEALATVMDGFAPLPSELVAIERALGRFVAAPVRASSDLPPFDNSAMDGYAVRASDTQNATADAPAELRCTTEVKAGDGVQPHVEAGCAVRIFTGAPLPDGADAVVMQENTTREGALVRVFGPARLGQNIRVHGTDVARGEMLVDVGHLVGSGVIGLFAAQRARTVACHARPRVAILSTGSELVSIDDEARPGTIVNSNAYSLGAQIEQAGGTLAYASTVSDDLERIAAAIETAIATADVVLTVGGVSVGDYDLVHAALARLRITPEITKVAMKPGKPFTFARAGRVPVIGLPGNPVSASVAFELFVRPGLRRMLGDPAPYPAFWDVELAADFVRSPGRVELARASVGLDGERKIATLRPNQGSGSLLSLVGVNALVVVPAGATMLSAGQRLRAQPMGGGLTRATPEKYT